MEPAAHHELVTVFESAGMALNATLTEMLDEHFSHQTERRGCGFTQASRVLAVEINKPRDAQDTADLALLADPPLHAIQQVLTQAPAHGLVLGGWRNLDQNPQVQAFLQQPAKADSSFGQQLRELVRFFDTLRHIDARLQLEESRLLVQWIQDLILPQSSAALNLPVIAPLGEKPKVGSCTLAEKFFLEIAHARLLRQGRINLLVDDRGQPLLLEKLNMGDSHSCISLTPLLMNGVRIPVGSMFSTQHEGGEGEQHPRALRPTHSLKGAVIAANAYPGYCLLRLSTLAVSPANRKRAFTTHFDWQGKEGLYSFDVIEMTELIALADQQVKP